MLEKRSDPQISKRYPVKIVIKTKQPRVRRAALKLHRKFKLTKQAIKKIVNQYTIWTRQKEGERGASENAPSNLRIGTRRELKVDYEADATDIVACAAETTRKGTDSKRELDQFVVGSRLKSQWGSGKRLATGLVAERAFKSQAVGPDGAFHDHEKGFVASSQRKLVIWRTRWWQRPRCRWLVAKLHRKYKAICFHLSFEKIQRMYNLHLWIQRERLG